MDLRPDQPTGRRAGALTLLLLGVAALVTTGCGALLRVGDAGTSAIDFASGELRSDERVSLAELDLACVSAIERLRYEDLEVVRTEDRVHFEARTAGGEPVDIRLLAKSPERTDLRIRIGVFGDEATSRLVLEEIHQSL